MRKGVSRRIGLPCCAFKNCRYQFDGNCTKPNEYEMCSRGNIFVMTEKVYEKYPHDNDVWLLLQEVARLGERINRIYNEFDLK